MGVSAEQGPLHKPGCLGCSDCLTLVKVTQEFRSKARSTRAMKAADRRKRRAAVIERDGTACHWCGRPDAQTLDHVVAHSEGGSHAIENLVLACNDCNQERGGTHGPTAHNPGEPSKRPPRSGSRDGAS